MSSVPMIGLAAVLALLLSGCSGTEGEPSIVGTWVGESAGHVQVEQFSGDGTTTCSAGTTRDSVEVVDRGEYTHADGVLTYGIDEYCHERGVDTGIYTATIEGTR